VQNNYIHSANKLKALKKDDGDPLWRKDIQYDFLKAVFEDRKAVFTNSYQSDQIIKQTFADLYIDTMARSSMTSKILRDKLLGEHESAKNMAMVCLLVNIGRMNTTLNCEFHLPR
jgi:Ino eighty subunit 1